jgi:HemY protein
MLLSAANDLDLDADGRRLAWARLGQLAEQEQRSDEAARFFRLAALLETAR